ncbi:MAG: ABC transporter ATP-binding protein [Pseudomonadota bacterium]
MPPPRSVVQTGDDSPAGSVTGYVRRMTGVSQLWLCLLAAMVSAIGLVPIDLQRRIIDGPITDRSLDGLLMLSLIYLGVVLVHRLLKFGLAMGQAWLTESAVLYTRGHLTGIYGERSPQSRKSGEAVSIINAEVERLGGFAGQAISQAVANAAMLVGILIYMLWVAPEIAALSIGLLLPQVLLVPLIQRRLNRLVERRVRMLRLFGEDLSGTAITDTGNRLRRIYRNRIQFAFWKTLMKGVLNTLNLLAPLGILLWGGYLVIEDAATVGVIVAFLSGFERMSNPLRELIAFYRQAAQAGVQHDQIAKWMRARD